MNDEKPRRGWRRPWVYALAAFAVFWTVDALWGQQLGIYSEDDSGPPAITTPASPFTWTPSPTVPTPPPVPIYTGPGVLCRDGWVSHSTGRGTCSHHGGER